MMTRLLFSLLVAVATAWPSVVQAQDESAIGAEFRREREAVTHSCGHFSLGAIPSCAITLVTANPLHVSFGNIAPKNGMAFGMALVGHHTPNESWRVTWSADAVRARGGAWRAGVYANFIQSTVVAPTPSLDEDDEDDADKPTEDTYPVYSVYAQTTSLTALPFFGLGQASRDENESAWAMRQTVLGGTVVFPLRRSGWLGLALTGGVAGRFINIADGTNADVPGMSEMFSPADVPGLGDHRNYLQVSGGVRVNPTRWTHVRPSYHVALDQFVSGTDRRFRRWTMDLAHEFPFYRTVRPIPRSGNTPNDCSNSISDHACPSPSRNRYGALSFRLLAIGSVGKNTGAVPFYFQPSIGGADIDNVKLLMGFKDYRFRDKNVFATQVVAEHSLIDIPLPRGVSLPLGGIVMVEQGKVVEHWRMGGSRRSYAAGVTIRAGGFPEVFLLFAWDDQRQRRFDGSINPSLLGGAPRPSLQ
jgi:hypothetical protein